MEGCSKLCYDKDYKKGELASAVPCGQDGNYCKDCMEKDLTSKQEDDMLEQARESVAISMEDLTDGT